jgi:hypothetical protein
MSSQDVFNVFNVTADCNIFKLQNIAVSGNVAVWGNVAVHVKHDHVLQTVTVTQRCFFCMCLTKK